MDDPYVTGRKRETLLYRHHTGYPGGLKEITFKEMHAKKPEQILIRTLLGMLPKNHSSRDAIKQNVMIFREPWHNLGNILP
jgi:large subunit ribosomal protein L13